MNLDKLFKWIIVVVIGFTVTGNLNKITHWIYKAQAQLIYESRSSAWCNPNIFLQK